MTDPGFWNEIENVAEILRRNELFILNALEAGSIAVKRVSPGRAEPVVWADLLKWGRSLYPL